MKGDRAAGALVVWFGPEGAKLAETEEVAPGIMLDFDESGEVSVSKSFMSAGARRNPRQRPERCLRVAGALLEIRDVRFGRALAKRAAQAPKFHKRGNGRGRN